MQAPLVEAVAIRNYRSIATARVELGALTFLVGPNGSGKSNFLDALRFVGDALNTTLEQALRDRGGIQAVRRRSAGHPTHFGIRLDLNLPTAVRARYAFEVGAERDGGFVVKHETCRVDPAPIGQGESFTVKEGRVVEASRAIHALVERDRLALTAVSGLPEFRPVFDALRGMGFYNLNPQRIRDLQDPDPGHILVRDGRNLAAVVRELGRLKGGQVLSQVQEHLQAVVPGVESVEHKAIGPKETLEFRQRVAGTEAPWRFLADSMSDGTLRALGILVAAFQAGADGHRRVTLVGIEEPELALHPGAADVIAVALLLASRRVQVLATTHSPDLLNHKEITERHLRAVTAEAGETQIGPVDAGVRRVLQDRLYAPGEMLAQGQLAPDLHAVREASNQMRLFDTEGE